MRYRYPLSYSASRWIGVHAPWKPGITGDFVEALKASFPVRAWDGATKTWWIPGGPENVKKVEQLFYFYFEERPSLGPEPGAPVNGHARPNGAVASYFDLGLDPRAPDAVVRAAYKALAQELHPDRNGGSREPFQKVERAYSEIRRERGI